MIFLALTQDSLSLIGLISKSEGLSLIVVTSNFTGTSSIRGGGADTDRDVSNKLEVVGANVSATGKMTKPPPTGRPPKTKAPWN